MNLSRLLLFNSPALSRLLAAMVFLAALVIPLHATVLTGTFDGVGTLTPTGMPGIFTQNLTGDGTDAFFGAFTIAGQSTIDFSSPPQIVVTSGMVTLTFSNGTLFGTTAGEGTANGMGMATFDGDFSITGGTGRFAGVTGDIMVNGTITRTSPTTEDINASYQGSITPEPSSLLLLATGLLSPVLMPGFYRKWEAR